ncbi:hypothetical protein BRADI_1g24705v3 [Brachypodium distachyon]|uniref:Uncharacterized protein n=1 Tax=Brachypodium distachyon TaxID=15368 RepID=A0A2K2DKY5_BRADI|nr:hypothetical protein BRADI_1g24705v3 [Brachypodium distachyon]
MAGDTTGESNERRRGRRKSIGSRSYGFDGGAWRRLGAEQRIQTSESERIKGTRLRRRLKKQKIRFGLGRLGPPAQASQPSPRCGRRNHGQTPSRQRRGSRREVERERESARSAAAARRRPRCWGPRSWLLAASARCPPPPLAGPAPGRSGTPSGRRPTGDRLFSARLLPLPATVSPPVFRYCFQILKLA